MKKKIVSTSFAVMLSLGMFLPVSHSFVNVGEPSTVNVNVNGGDNCFTVVIGGRLVTICNLETPQVSWNSGGG